MHCRRCGARLQQGMLICPECGARQRQQGSSIRCAHCHGRVSVGLMVCPHCGRTVRPAGPRWALWALVLAVLVLASLGGLGRLPVERARQEVTDTRARLASLVQVLELATPRPASASVQAGAPGRSPALLAAITVTPTLTVTMTVTQPEIMPELTAQVITSTAVVTSVARAAPTVASTATPTATSTPSAIPTASATRPALTAVAARGTPTVGAAVARAATPIAYVVKAGDTLAQIGASFGVPWEAIAAANRISAANSLQIGQRLTIPTSGASISIPPSAMPRPSPTTPPMLGTPTPAPGLTAPVLDSPAHGTPFEGDRVQIELKWLPVSGIPSGAQYRVTIEWLQGGQKAGEHWDTTATGIRMPPQLWGRADQPSRQYVWYVQVVQKTTDGKGGERVIELSPPSALRTLEWH